MMRSGLPLLMVAAMIAAGCQTVSYQTTDSAAVESVVFSSSEENLAKALAVFLYGRIHEGERRRGPTVALPYYHLAANLAPGSHIIQGRIALAALLRSDIETAIAALETSHAAKPDDATRQVDLASLYQLANRNDDAARLFEQSLILAPTNTAVYLAIGDIYLQQGKDARAIDIINKGFDSVEDTHPLSEYLYQKARQFVAVGELERAIRFFELVSEWNEQDRAEIGYVVGELYLAQKRAMDALQTLSDTIKLPEAPAAAFLRLGSLLLEQEQAEEAIQVIRTGNQKYPDLASFPLALGGLYAEDGRYEEALLAYESAVRIARQKMQDQNQFDKNSTPNPLQQNVLLAMAAVQEQLGRHEDAYDTLEQILTDFPDSHLAMNFLAYMWAEQNIRIDEAYALSQKSLELDPQNGAYLDTLGWIYFRKGEWNQALDYLKQADGVIGDDYEINLHLGDVHAAQGNDAMALQYWQKSLMMKPAPENRAWQQLESLGIDPAIWLSNQQPAAESDIPAKEAE